MPTLKIYKNGAFEKAPTPKKYDGSAWQDLTNMNVYEDNTWINILERGEEYETFEIGTTRRFVSIIGAKSSTEWNELHCQAWTSSTTHQHNVAHQLNKSYVSGDVIHISFDAYCSSGSNNTLYVTHDPSLNPKWSSGYLQNQVLSTAENHYDFSITISYGKVPSDGLYFSFKPASESSIIYIKNLRIDDVLYVFPDYVQ